MSTPETGKPLSKQTKAELLATASAAGVEVAEDATNAVIIAAIEAANAPTQADPTAPRARDETGRELDEFDLPLSGPARRARLAELGKRDPREFPEDFNASSSTPTPPPASGQAH
jgi:hypothetical protein